MCTIIKVIYYHAGYEIQAEYCGYPLFEVTKNGKIGTRGSRKYLESLFGMTIYDGTQISVHDSGKIVRPIANQLP